MDANSFKFKEGDRVLHHFGIKGEFIQEAVVSKLHKTSRFKIDKSSSQFRQTGRQAGNGGVWGQEWVEVWSHEAEEKVLRDSLERRAREAVRIFVLSMPRASRETLEYVSEYLEGVNHKAIGE